jgi:hypothetical protein
MMTWKDSARTNSALPNSKSFTVLLSIKSRILISVVFLALDILC